MSCNLLDTLTNLPDCTAFEPDAALVTARNHAELPRQWVHGGGLLPSCLELYRCLGFLHRFALLWAYGPVFDYGICYWSTLKPWFHHHQ